MKRTMAFGGLVATAGLLAAGLAAPAQAAGDVASDALATNGMAAWNTVGYWFAEHRANLINATPYNVETKVVAKHVSKGGPAPDSKPGVVPAIGDEKKTVAKSKNVNLPKTTGKVFFRAADGKPHWCTATSVQSAYKNLVATAGHCVYDTESNSSTMRNWVFVPAYYQSKTPYGIYVGKQAFTHYDYDVYEDADRDYAFVTVYNGLNMPHDGIKKFSDVPGAWQEVSKETYDNFPKWFKDWDFEEFRCHVGLKYYVWKFEDTGALGANVGGQGLAYNQKVGKPVFVFGYPSGQHPDGNQAFSGQTLKWTYGKTFAVQAPAIKGEELVGTKSSFTGEGALGSAWLVNYNNGRRLGYLNGVTIGVSDTDNNNRYDTSFSPYFDGELAGVYNAAKNLWSGSIATPFESPAIPRASESPAPPK
ncbi:trypsin-like serine peptidase [Microtetraspora malaysiensis]|uniref:trypsin-like serine peptidase n=1 Tax=Microtetraspora malaysiensis TaxID=161358 RepID=UPI003D906B7D